jgi:hypothetical protein
VGRRKEKKRKEKKKKGAPLQSVIVVEKSIHSGKKLVPWMGVVF